MRRQGEASTPFERALGRDELDKLSPTVRDHFLMTEDVMRYEGVMTKVWSKPGLARYLSYPGLLIGSAFDILFKEVGEDIPFELENRRVTRSDGISMMTWDRVFHFPSRIRRFYAEMIYDEARASILDYLGNRRGLQVELHASVVEGGMQIVSGRQELCLPSITLPLPPSFAGKATVFEQEQVPGRVSIDVKINTPLLGDFFGYTGFFSRVRV